MTKRQGLPLLLCLFLCLALFSSTLHAEMIKSSSSLAAKSAQRIPSSTTTKPTIMLDAGHGGRDEGTKVHSLKEKRITLSTTLYAKKYLEEMGYRVILTRGRDIEMSLPRRVALANQTKTALFVSIHFNFSRNHQASGVEIFYYNGRESFRAKESRKLANDILHQVIDQTQAASRGVKNGNFHVIRETLMPAVLVEGGFVSNDKECAKLRRKEYLEQIAKGVALGVDKYFKGKS